MFPALRAESILRLHPVSGIDSVMVQFIQTHPLPDADYYFLGAFFLPATVLRFPLRVRLLVRVR